MNNNNDIPQQPTYGTPIPTTLSAADVLFEATNEMRHSIASIEGYTKMISLLRTTDNHYTDGILGNIERLHDLRDAIRVYLMETDFLHQEKMIMSFLHERVFDPIMNSPQASSDLKKGIVLTVRALNSLADWQMMDTWTSMASYQDDSKVIQQMQVEGFMDFEKTLSEFQKLFTQDINRPDTT